MQPRNRRKTKSSLGCWSGCSPIAIAGMVATVAIVAPVRAAALNQWAFDANTHQLTLSLPQGVTPTYFLLAEPARIVLDVPNTTLGAVPLDQQYSGAVRRIRLSEIQGGTRIVMELAPNTRLDPRHAELTSAEAGNGRTQWTLRPLVQDGVPSPSVAAASPAPPPATPAPAPSRVSPEPDVSEAPTVPVASPPAPPEATVEGASEAQAPPEVAVEPEPLPPVPATTPLPEPPAPAEAVPLPVVPAPSTALPEIAHSATTGAAQALPTAAALMQGVRTDAAALAGVGEEAVADFPPEQLPIDPFGPGTQAVVSVPPLEGDASPRPPQVSVPPLAEVPEVPSAPTPGQISRPETVAETAPTSAEGEAAAIASSANSPAAGPPSPAPQASTPAVPPNQIRPPRSQTVEIAPPPVEPPVSTLPATAFAPGGAPPPVAANQIRPPRPPAQAERPETAIAPPPAVPAASTRQIASAPVPPPPVVDSPPSIPPPPLVEPPLQTIGNPSTASVAPPPFLTGTGTVPRVEQPSIPPPPPLPSKEDGTVPFGAPLPPQAKAVDTEDALPVSGARVDEIPVGTRLLLRYPGDTPITLTQQEPVYDVLILAQDVLHPETQERLLTAGSRVIGRFEGFDESGRRFVTQMVISGSDRQPLLAESDWLLGTPQPHSGNMLVNSGVGAVAVAALSGFSGIGLLGGAAIGATSTLASAPRVVSIEPGQFIEAEVVSAILPFNDAPNLSQGF